MYLNLGKRTAVRKAGIVGIFDLDICSQSHITRKFLAAAEKAGQVINAAEDIPRSFVVYSDGGQNAVYLSQFSAATLLRRWEGGPI